MHDTLPVHPGLETLADAFYMVDPAWRVTYWNPAAARVFGVEPDDALGRLLWNVVPALEESPVAEHLQHAMGEHEVVETLVPHLPGCCEGHYAVRAAPLDEGGLAVHFRDATHETKLAERYSHLLESIRDGFAAVDPDGSIVYINQVAERLLRLPRSRALGAQVWSFLPERPERIARCLRATLADGVPRHLRRIRPEAPVFDAHYFDLWIHPLPGGGISVLFQDTTRLVEREKALSRFAAEADEANRAKSRFFAAVSHELRTPLNALVGYTHLLTTDTYGHLPPAAQRAAERAGVCAEHLSRLIDDILLMTTAEIAKLPVVSTPISLPHYLPSAVEPIRQQAEAKGLRFAMTFAPDTPEVQTDPDRLRQLLHALLSNAVKFTDRGEIGLHISGFSGEAASEGGRGAAPHARPRPSEGVRIRVSDTGPGIPQAAQDRIFEAFEQLGDPARSDSLRRGPGLGLTVARHLTRLLRGTLSLERTGDSGSTFRLDLPLRVEE